MSKTQARGQSTNANPLTAQNLLRLPVYFARGLRYHAAGRVYTPKPLVAGYRVTRRCNSRCVMCSDWKTGANSGELTLAEIREIFGNRLFDSVEKFILSGGEQTLREDLVEIAEVALQCCPRVKELVLLSNGLETSRVVDSVKALSALAVNRKLGRLAVSVSIDGCEGVHEEIRRVPRAFERVAETARQLKALQAETPFYFHAVCVVQPLNLGGLVEVAEYGSELGLPITFVPVCVGDSFVPDSRSEAALRFTDEQLAKLEAVFTGELQTSLGLSNVPLWREYFRITRGHKRRVPCILRRHFAGVDGDGTLYMCNADSSLDQLWFSEEAKRLRDTAEQGICTRCTVCCDLALTLSQEFFYYARFLATERARKLLGLVGGRDGRG